MRTQANPGFQFLDPVGGNLSKRIHADNGPMRWCNHPNKMKRCTAPDCRCEPATGVDAVRGMITGSMVVPGPLGPVALAVAMLALGMGIGIAVCVPIIEGLMR